jgi:hypothetical protein
VDLAEEASGAKITEEDHKEVLEYEATWKKLKANLKGEEDDKQSEQ